MENNNFDINQQIENSSIEEKINQQKQIADDILNSVKNKPELRDKFTKEYQEHRNAIIEARLSDQKITIEELKIIKKEFEDLQSL
jgi:hypothetical protein